MPRPRPILPGPRRLRAWALALSLALVLSVAGRALAQETPPLIESHAWQARFVEWVEEHLVVEQIAAAAEHLPAFDRRFVLRVLDRLEDDQVLALGEPPLLPEQARAKMLARGVEGDALAAARKFADGEHAQALDALRAPHLAADAAAQHMRAQLLDHLTADFDPLYRLYAIDLYRVALRLGPDMPQADRALLRIGQIYLEIGFAAEARAALRTLLAREPDEPYRTAALLSLAEAAYADRAPVRAIEHLARIELEPLRAETRGWIDRRHADSLARLERYAEAVTLYGGQAIAGQAGSLLRVRHAFALLHTNEWREAQPLLESVATSAAPHSTRAVAYLLLARAHRRASAFEEASQLATRATQLAPGTQLAALAAAEVLEAERELSNGPVSLPAGTAPLVQDATFAPSVGLLSYLALSTPNPGDTPEQQRRRLGSLSVTLPPGLVQQLAHRHLVSELAQDLADIATGRSEPAAAVLADTGRYLRPETMDENVLLLATESMRRAGDMERCVRWARVIQRREPRPLRRGIGTWRAINCRYPNGGDEGVARSLMVLADSGEAGPFALAVAAIAAEIHLRQGELERAALTYARAVESLSEPSFVGPVLLRLGEVEVALGRDALGLRRLARGLALTDGPDAAAEPFRKAGLVALARASARSGQTEPALSLLRAERERAGDWWGDAYAYLLMRSGEETQIDGDSVFARGARERDAIGALRERLQKILQRQQGAGTRGTSAAGPTERATGAPS